MTYILEPDYTFWVPDELVIDRACTMVILTLLSYRRLSFFLYSRVARACPGLPPKFFSLLLI